MCLLSFVFFLGVGNQYRLKNSELRLCVRFFFSFKAPTPKIAVFFGPIWKSEMVFLSLDGASWHDIMMHFRTLFCSRGLWCFHWFPLHICFMGGFWRITVILTFWNLRLYDSFVNKFTYQEVVFLAGCQEVFNPNRVEHAVDESCGWSLHVHQKMPSQLVNTRKMTRSSFKPPGVPWFSQHFIPCDPPNLGEIGTIGPSWGSEVGVTSRLGFLSCF